MTLRFVDYRTAITTKNRHSSWYNAADRLKPEAWPHIRPTFALKPGGTILTIGSCFARSIEDHLARIGFDVPTLSLGTSGQAWILNKYTPPSISQEVSWAAGIYRRSDSVTEDDCRPYCYQLQNGTVIDNNIADFEPVSYEDFIARRRLIYSVLRQAFLADCVILTPGLAEAWYDRDRGIFIQKVLTGHHSAISRNLQFAMLDFQTCFDCLDQAVAEVRSLNAEAKFLITTSPIPLEHTFTGDDIIVANTHAKSVLRAACGEVVAKWDGVDYFPSYESVTLTRDWKILNPDGIHVDRGFVNKIVNRTIEFYCGEIGDAESLFEAALSEPELDKALAHLHGAMARAPDVLSYRLALPTLHLTAGDFEGAMQANDEVVDYYLASGHTSHPDYAKPEAKLMFRLQIHQRQGDLEKERDVLVEILNITPDAAFMHFRLGGVLWRLNDIAGAEAPLMRAWELKTYDPLAVGLSLGNTWCQLGKSREAIDLLRGMASEWADDTRLWTLLGNAYLQGKDVTRAEAAFAKAVEVDPSNDGARYNMDKLRELAAARTA